MTRKLLPQAAVSNAPLVDSSHSMALRPTGRMSHTAAGRHLSFLRVITATLSRLPLRNAGSTSPRLFPLLFLIFTLVYVICGCTMAPKYTQPEAPIPAEWPSGPAYEATQAEPVATVQTEIPWRDFFSDDRLRQIIEIALNNNRDLRVAALNVERARALYGIQRAELLPTVNAAAGTTGQHVPRDLSGFGKSVTVEQYSVDLGIASWEIDFFGRIRSLKDRALEEYLATEQARRSAQIMLISEVAGVYLALAADQESFQIARSTLEAQQASYELVRRYYEVGLIPEVDLYRAQTQVDSARVDMARYTRQLADDKNALDFLAGTPVPDSLLPADLDSVTPPREFSPGMSSEVLLSRPDILQAENLLRAAHANIGAARAAFFPRISLSTAVGTASDQLNDLFKSGTLAWNYAPQIVMPIFDPRTWYALRGSKVEREIAVAEYEKAIQVAFREVATALALRGTVGEQLAAQQSLVHASAETYRLVNMRYTKGVDSYLGVLDAQRSLYAAQQGLVTIRFAKLANQVRLYAVLGGGSDEAVADEGGS